MASAASPTPNRLGVDEAARRAMPPPRLAQLGAKLTPNCSKLRHAIWKLGPTELNGRQPEPKPAQATR